MLGLARLLCLSLILAAGLLYSSAVSTRGQSPDPKLKGTGSIAGRVTLGGKAAPNIPVAAIGIQTASRRPAAQTNTDSEGRYRLSALSPAQYQIVTLTPALTPADEGTDNSYGPVFFGSHKNVVLAAGEQVEDIDLKLVKGSVITGRVTDQDSKPVIDEHVSIQLIDEAGNPSRKSLPAIYNGQMYQTDDRGVYRIFGLPAGRYRVSVGSGADGGVVGSNGRGYYPQTFYPDVTDQAKATLVDLGEGSEAANVDIQVGRRADTYSAAGRVMDSETGQPIPGTRIAFLVGQSGQNSPFITGSPTGSRGEFRIDGLAPGHYGAYVSSDYGGSDLYSDPVYFDLVDKDVSGLEIKAIHGLSLSGVVVTDGDTQKDALAQLPNLRVTASVSSLSKRQTDNSSSALVAADGTFQISGLRPGRVAMGIYSATPEGKRPSIARIEHAGIGLTQGFEIQPGQSISGLRVVISYGTGVIRGAVKFEGGTPPPDARMFIRCSREGRNEGTGAQLDSRGHFVVTNLATGTYDVALQILFSMQTQPGQRSKQPQKQQVTVTNDAEAEVLFVVDLKPKEAGP